MYKKGGAKLAVALNYMEFTLRQEIGVKGMTQVWYLTGIHTNWDKWVDMNIPIGKVDKLAAVPRVLPPPSLPLHYLAASYSINTKLIQNRVSSMVSANIASSPTDFNS